MSGGPRFDSLLVSGLFLLVGALLVVAVVLAVQ